MSQDNTRPEDETHICSVCGDKYTGFGNNAEPINDGRCCDNCNGIVIEHRMANYRRGLPLRG